MPRGRKATSAVCSCLEELLASGKPPEQFYPFEVELAEKKVYVFARTTNDAIRKAARNLAKVRPCSVQEIVNATQYPSQYSEAIKKAMGNE